MITALKLGAAIAVLVYLEQRGKAFCAGKENGTTCGQNRICWTGNGYKNACLERARYKPPDAEIGASVQFEPWDVFGGLDTWFDQAQEYLDVLTGDDRKPIEGPITSTNDPRVQQ